MNLEIDHVDSGGLYCRKTAILRFSTPPCAAPMFDWLHPFGVHTFIDELADAK